MQQGRAESGPSCDQFWIVDKCSVRERQEGGREDFLAHVSDYCQFCPTDGSGGQELRSWRRQHPARAPAQLVPVQHDHGEDPDQVGFTPPPSAGSVFSTCSPHLITQNGSIELNVSVSRVKEAERGVTIIMPGPSAAVF